MCIIGIQVFKTVENMNIAIVPYEQMIVVLSFKCYHEEYTAHAVHPGLYICNIPACQALCH